MINKTIRFTSGGCDQFWCSLAGGMIRDQSVYTSRTQMDLNRISGQNADGEVRDPWTGRTEENGII